MMQRCEWRRQTVNPIKIETTWEQLRKINSGKHQKSQPTKSRSESICMWRWFWANTMIHSETLTPEDQYPKPKPKMVTESSTLKIHFTCLLLLENQFYFQPGLEGGYPLESPGQTRWWWSEQSWLSPSRPTGNVHIERNAVWSCDSKGGCNVFVNFIFPPVFPRV